MAPFMPVGLNRRALLQGSATAAVAPALTGLGGRAFATETLPPLTTPGRLSQNEFIQLSALLTGHGDLKSEVGVGLFEAYAPGSADNRSLAELYEKIRTSGLSSVDTLASGLRGTPMFDCAVSIVSAWYLGMTGTGAETRLVTYEDALMFRPVADVLAVPTFCFDETGAWAVPPPGIDQPNAPATQVQPPADPPSEKPR